MVVLGFVLVIVSSLVTSASAAECVKAKLSPDYSEKTCTVGNLEFKFPVIELSSFHGSADKAEVEPVTNGLKFSIPLVKPKDAQIEPGPRYITAEYGIEHEVKGVGKTIVDAALGGGLAAVPKGASASVRLRVRDDATKATVALELDAFSASKVVLKTPVAAGTVLPVNVDFVVHRVDTGTLTFTETFTPQ